jgi:hypothetical protein
MKKKKKLQINPSLVNKSKTNQRIKKASKKLGIKDHTLK